MTDCILVISRNPYKILSSLYIILFLLFSPQITYAGSTVEPTIDPTDYPTGDSCGSLAAPSNLTAAANAAIPQINLSWVNNSPTAQRFTIERSQDQGNTW